MEEWLRENAIFIIGFVGTGMVALWRISQLEKRQDKHAEHSRENWHSIYVKLEENSKETALLQGELRGRGYINGSD